MKGRLGVVVLLGLTLAVTPVGASSDRTTGSRAAAITAGIGHTCALTRLGGVKCWGYNGHDELGTGDYALPFSSTPVDVFGLSGVTAISAGVRHTCALTAGGGVKCWGSNAQGMLGDGTTEDRWTPTDVSGLGSGVTAIAAGIFTTCAVTSSGRVKCWGLHYGPTPAEVPGLIGAVAITAAVPICALTTTGGVKCWGGGNYGWTPVDIPGLGSGVTAIAANTGHAWALRTGGG